MNAGDRVFTYLCGFVVLVREMNGESGVDGWEVRRADGSAAFLTYDDVELTEDEISEIRKALATARVRG